MTVPDRNKAPLIYEPVQFDIKLPGYEKAVLSNGVEVYQVNMGSEDTLQLNWVFYAGSWFESRKSQAAAVNFLLKNGTARRNAYQINEHFEYYGAYLNRACYTETAEITLHCLNKHVHELLPVVAELIREATFPEEELALYRQNTLQRLQVSLQHSDFVAGRLIDERLYGSVHPYGKYSQPADYEALRRDHLAAFYDQYYRKGRCILFVAGKIPGDLLDHLEKSFGQLPLRPHHAAAMEPAYPVTPDPVMHHRLVNDPKGIQAAIRMARPFPNRHHPDFPKALVLNNIFGGYFGSRLMANIREDKGYTYGIYSFLQNHLRENAWVISTEAGRDVSEQTIREVYNEMEELRTELIDAEELRMCQNYMMGSILGDLDGPFQVIGRWRNLMMHGLDEDYFYHSLDIIRTITSAELRDLAQQYFQPEAFYEVVVV